LVPSSISGYRYPVLEDELGLRTPITRDTAVDLDVRYAEPVYLHLNQV